MSFQFEWDKNDVYVRFYRELTFLDFRQVNDLFYGDPRFDDMRYPIADLTDVMSINLTEHEVKIISTLEKSATHWNNSVKVAHVTTDNYMQKLVHAYEAEMQGSNWSC